VIPYGTWVPVAVRLVANCYTPFTTPYLYRATSVAIGRIYHSAFSAAMRHNNHEIIAIFSRPVALRARVDQLDL